ncbi:HvfC/BufC family peptide modification chaperone [Serratia fonticola]
MATRHSVPVLLANAEKSFSDQLRARNSGERVYSQGISLYRKIVRENINGVLQSVFPLFCDCLKEASVRNLIDDFLHQHHANQPEFHQIATELLLFIRQLSDISSKVRALIEYEWLIYSVEIDESDVPIPHKMRLQSKQINNVEIKMNPTLKIITLPFCLNEGVLSDKGEGLLNYYALYRKRNNEIFMKKLNQDDLRFLLEMNDPDVTAKVLKNKIAHYFPAKLFTVWLENNSNDELFSLTLKE